MDTETRSYKKQLNVQVCGLFKILKLNKSIRSNNVKFSSLLLEIGVDKINTFKITKKWKTTDVCNEIYKNIYLGT